MDNNNINNRSKGKVIHTGFSCSLSACETVKLTVDLPMKGSGQKDKQPLKNIFLQQECTQ